MDHAKRRAISYVAGSLLTGTNGGVIFDYSTAGYFNFGGSTQPSISIFDFSRSSYLVGTSESVFDYSTNRYISLTLRGGGFSGFDYESNSFFSGTLAGKAISFFDYGTNQYYDFSL